VAFPTSINGRFSIPQVSAGTDVRMQILEQASILLGSSSDDVTTFENTIFSKPSFTAWFFSYGNNWHPMVPFDNITLTISGTPSLAFIDYTLSTKRMLWIVSGMIALGMVLAVCSSSLESLSATVLDLGKFALWAFTLLFGGNYLLGLFRGPDWLHSKLLTGLRS
jgi:hypothetical protein